MPGFAVPRQWPGETVVIAATGPSLTVAQIAAVRGRARLIAVNDAYQLAPWAEALYAADDEWISHHRPDLAGQKWTQCEAWRDRDGWRWVKGIGGEGLSTDPAVIHWGSNSGFQACNLALHFGARKLILIGFDMKMGAKRHFFGDHPGAMNKQSPYGKFIRHFEQSVPDFEAAGVTVINATPESALTCFPMMDLGEALGH